MIKLNELIKVLKDEGIELPEIEIFSLTESLNDQGFDSMMRADIYITLGEFYNVELMDIEEDKLRTFESIINFIDNAKSR